MIKVAVVIPFYQEKPGILRRALNSVLRQQLPAGTCLDIIVVNDGSLVAVHSEIEGLKLNSADKLTVIDQKNQGVAMARNMGLCHVSRDTRYIAFLDSDDIWHPIHLHRAITSLEQGYDFYFCDCRRVGNRKSFFEERKFGDFLASVWATSIGDNVYAVDKGAFYRNSLRKRTSMIPAVVYKRSVAPRLEFDKSLRVSGEDCLFLFQLIARCSNICCSSDELVTCGEGVNIYASHDNWNDFGHLIRQIGGLLALYKFKKMPYISRTDNNFFDFRIKKVRQIFAFLTVRHIIKYHALWPKELIAIVRQDKKFWLWYPFYVLYVVVCFPLHLYDPLDDFWGEYA